MELEKLNRSSHRRYNILTGEWVLVSPHRTKRPWQGQEEESNIDDSPSYVEDCYLCPGNLRANGERNQNYQDTFVFDNDFAAIQSDIASEKFKQGLLQAETETGICKVVCFSPDHSKSLANLSQVAIEKVIAVWMDQYTLLGAKDDINYVQIFENKGAIMGCSNPHPHGQIWAHRSIPNEIEKKNKFQERYFHETGKSLVKDYLKDELATGKRILFENSDFVVLIPFWAVWPYETMIIPKSHQSSIAQLSQEQIKGFAEAISLLTKMYDRLYKVSFPYSSGIHQAPTHSNSVNHWHWHMSFYPPLLRSATVKKFMVGYEMFATPQRDLTPELAATTLRSLIT